MIPSSHHCFVQYLSFDNTHEFLSVDMQGHDLKKAIRIKNLYPQSAPRLTMKRLVSMYAKSPFTNAEFENLAQSDESVIKHWTGFRRLEDLQRLEAIRKAHADAMYKLVHWCARNGLLENLAIKRNEKPKRQCQ